MFFSLMDGNLRYRIKGRAMIPAALGSGDKGKVRAHNGGSSDRLKKSV